VKRKNRKQWNKDGKWNLKEEVKWMKEKNLFE
jgi:hypothetical protein